LTTALKDDDDCYDNEINREEFYTGFAEITTVTPDHVTGNAATVVKEKNAETMQELQWFYGDNMYRRLPIPENICIRHLIKRLDDCHRELSNLAEKGSFDLNHSTRFLTRPQAFPKSAKMFER
jgi:hypothetical protein